LYFQAFFYAVKKIIEFLKQKIKKASRRDYEGWDKV
jgi:hypothetical protein